MSEIQHRTADELQAGLDEIGRSPVDDGTLELIVRRPDVGVREVLAEGELDVADGLVGDNWSQRSSSTTADGSPHPDMQLTLINSRLLALISPDPERRALAGDQLAVDLSLSPDDLPVWSRLRIGDAVLEVTDQPHIGCSKFTQRFGLDALRFVNSEEGRAVNLRGINARVVQPGTIHQGDRITVEQSTS
jgi:MOSC domain-containing protein YiiM